MITGVVACAALIGGLALGIAACHFGWGPYRTLHQVWRTLRGSAENESHVRGQRYRKAVHSGSGVTRAPSALEPGSALLQQQIDQLEALGYAAGSLPFPGDAGVAMSGSQTIERALLVVNDGHAPEATLMNIRGEVLHSWSKPFHEAFPQRSVSPDALGIGHFRRVKVLPEGALLAIYEGHGLIKLDSESKLLWAYDEHAHHDIALWEDGTIFTLTRKAHVVPAVNSGAPVLEDFIVQLSSAGKVLFKLSVLEAIQNSPYRALLENSGRAGDIFHTNSITVLDGRLSDRMPAFRRGNLLLSLFRVNAVIIVDPIARSVVWMVGGLTRMQHDPSLLEEGRLLLFDNRGDNGASRVLEYDILNQRVPWEYRGSEHGFYTATCGAAQRLASGNTLITESDRGRAFIISPTGETLWEYITPNRAPQNSSLVATLFEVQMLAPDYDLSWLRAKR